MNHETRATMQAATVVVDSCSLIWARLHGHLVSCECARPKPDITVRLLVHGHAFTIIEILIVVALLAIVGLIAVPMMSSAASIQIQSAAEMIAADLEYAKSMASSRGQSFSVVFDTTTEAYRIKDQNGNVIQHPIKKGFDYVIDFRNDRRLNRVNIVDANFDGTNEVKFDYLGSPYNGNAPPTPLNNSGVISLQAGGINKMIRVEPVTGYISISN